MQFRQNTATKSCLNKKRQRFLNPYSHSSSCCTLFNANYRSVLSYNLSTLIGSNQAQDKGFKTSFPDKFELLNGWTFRYHFTNNIVELLLLNFWNSNKIAETIVAIIWIQKEKKESCKICKKQWTNKGEIRTKLKTF